MPYEVFEAGPAVYVPYILISLAITLIAYGMFPLIFARARRKVITRKKYRMFCFAFNLLVVIGFCIINGGFSSWAPYLLWTTVFSSAGIKMLINKGRLGEPRHCAKPREDTAAAPHPPETTASEAYAEASEAYAEASEAYAEAPGERTSVDEPLSSQARAELPEPTSSRQPKPSKRGLTASLIVVCVLLAASLSLNAVQYFDSRSTAEILSGRAEKITELYEKVAALNASNTFLRNTVSSVSEKANLYDFICLELSSGDYGYASSSFNASESVIVLSRYETGRKFTLTANWPSGGTVQYYRTGTSADISFDSDTWYTSTTMSVLPLKEGVTKFTFYNTVDSSEFKLMVIVSA